MLNSARFALTLAVFLMPSVTSDHLMTDGKLETGAREAPDRLHAGLTDGTVAAGQLSFWMDGPIAGGLSVSVNGRSVGNLGQWFSSRPACGQRGTLTVSVPAGTNYVSAAGSGLVWNSTSVRVAAGQCFLFFFHAPPASSSQPPRSSSPPPQPPAFSPTTGLLSISTNYPLGASVSVDGGSSYKAWGASPEPRCGNAHLTISVPPGTHVITAYTDTDVPGYWNAATWRVTATVSAGQCTPVRLIGPAQVVTAPTPPRVTIYSSDPYMQMKGFAGHNIYLDGRFVGTTNGLYVTDFRSCGGLLTIEVSVGAHRVVVDLGSNRSRSYPFTSAPNGCTTVDVGK